MKTQQTLTGLPLVKFGFIHVTGLIAKRGDEEMRIEPRSFTELGRFDGNNGMDQIITTDGEVWLRHVSRNFNIWLNPEFNLLVKQLCPRGRECFVHCSNGEGIPSYALFNRVADPYWTGVRGEFRTETEWSKADNTMVREEPVLA